AEPAVNLAQRRAFDVQLQTLRKPLRIERILPRIDIGEAFDNCLRLPRSLLILQVRRDVRELLTSSNPILRTRVRRSGNPELDGHVVTDSHDDDSVSPLRNSVLLEAIQMRNQLVTTTGRSHRGKNLCKISPAIGATEARDVLCDEPLRLVLVKHIDTELVERTELAL